MQDIGTNTGKMMQFWKTVQVMISNSSQSLGKE